MIRIRRSPAAETDLLEIWLTIAEDNPPAADKVLREIERAIRFLVDQPEGGKARPELGIKIRSLTTQTPYIVYYSLEPEILRVLRVLHHARDVPGLF